MMSKKQKQSHKLSDKPLYILSVSAVAAFIVMLIALSVTKERSRGEFVPPVFESTAQQGVPEVPEELGYTSPYQEGMAYRFSVCANVTMDGDLATVYFTNPEENTVYLKLRVLNGDGEILGETGLLKPGEYVSDVVLCNNLALSTEVRLKIMSYEPGTYMSAGSVVLKTEIGN